MSTKARQERLVQVPRRGQQIENRSIAQTSEIIERTRNPVIKMAMEIADEANHDRLVEGLNLIKRGMVRSARAAP
jgi:hypothetical protein